MELQYFRENPFFSDPVLKKEYRYDPPSDADGEKEDEWGVTDAQSAFGWDVNVKPQVLGPVSTYLHQPLTLFCFLGYQDPLER